MPHSGSDFLGDGTGAANAARRTVKGGEKAVAGRFHLMTAKAYEVAPDRGVMMVEEVAPTLVAERGGLLGRTDDVGEENCGEDAIDPDRRPRPRQEFLDDVGNLVGVLADKS